MNLKVYYDPQVDVLYLARPGKEEQVTEAAPGVNLEYDINGELLGVEILNASRVMREIVEPLREKALTA